VARSRFLTGRACAGVLALTLCAPVAMLVPTGMVGAQASKPQSLADKSQPQNRAAVRTPPELRYQLKTPRAWDYWVLADSADTAESCYTFANDASTKEYVESHVKSGSLKKYLPGAICELTGTAKNEDSDRLIAYSMRIISGKDSGTEGWVAQELVELTPESKKIKVAQDSAKAEQQRRARAELRARCAEVYKATIDKKVGDLTVREEEQVRACRTLGLYPP